MVDSVAKRLLVELLSPKPPLRSFAVLDAAANDELLDRLYDDPLVEFDHLLPGEPSADVFHVAPFVADVTNCEELKGWLSSGWGKAWGIYVVAEASLDGLQRHLRQFVQAMLPDATPVYCRFYDPRVFEMIVDVLDEAQREAFFRNLTAIYCESLDGYVVSYSNQGGRLLRSIMAKE